MGGLRARAAWSVCSRVLYRAAARERKRRIKNALRVCAASGLEAASSDCPRAQYRAAARERGDRQGSRRSAVQVVAMRASEDQEMLALASSLPLAQRARYLSLFA